MADHPLIHKYPYVCSFLRLGPSPLDTGTPDSPLMPWSCFFDFAIEHWFGCRTTEPDFAGDIAAVEIWLIDWLIDWLTEVWRPSVWHAYVEQLVTHLFYAHAWWAIAVLLSIVCTFKSSRHCYSCFSRISRNSFLFANTNPRNREGGIYLVKMVAVYCPL